MRLLLIRHGQTPSNVEGLLDTRIPGPGLTELGLEQAAAVPDALSGEGIEAIVVSDMVRTHLTAAPLVAATRLSPIERGDVREIASGDYEMKKDPASVRGYMGRVFAWAAGALEERMPGGESGSEVMERFDRVVAEAAGTGAEVVAIVSHGAMIRAWVGYRADNVTQEFVIENNLENTGVVVLEGDPISGWRALTWMGEPVGGERLADDAAVDPIGEGDAES